MEDCRLVSVDKADGCFLVQWEFRALFNKNTGLCLVAHCHHSLGASSPLWLLLLVAPHRLVSVSVCCAGQEGLELNKLKMLSLNTASFSVSGTWSVVSEV